MIYYTRIIIIIIIIINYLKINFLFYYFNIITGVRICMHFYIFIFFSKYVGSMGVRNIGDLTENAPEKAYI